MPTTTARTRRLAVRMPNGTIYIDHRTHTGEQPLTTAMRDGVAFKLVRVGATYALYEPIRAAA